MSCFFASMDPHESTLPMQEGWNAASGEWTPGSPVHRILAATREGASLSYAAWSVGVSRRMVESWLRRGDDLDEAADPDFGVDETQLSARDRCYWHFFRRFNYERAAFNIELVGVWRRAALEHGDWRAAAALLATRNPEEWGERRVVEHVAVAGGQGGDA